jgi:hypothetical protein
VSTESRLSAPVDAARLAQAVTTGMGTMTATALAEASGLTPRSVRAILAGDGARTFTRATLAKLDGPLRWAPGQAWAHYRSAAPPAEDLVGAQLRIIDERVDDPALAAASEAITLLGRMSEEDRRTWLAVGRSLARP